MKICLAQISSCWNNPKAGLEIVRNSAEKAARKSASLIVFPEQILTGWDPLDRSFAETQDGELVRKLREISRDINIAMLVSYRELKDVGTRNTCIAIDKTGAILASYSKIHLFSPGKEDSTYLPGDNLGIFTLDSCLIGVAICYDLRFAPLFNLYRQREVQLMLVPSAWPSSRMHHFELFTTARAAEFQMFVASVNTVGTTSVDTYSGGSLIIGPEGSVLVQGSDKEELLFCDISPEEVLKTRVNFPVHADRIKVNYSEIKNRIKGPLPGH
jgi:predicted amidohydrolase